MANRPAGYGYTAETTRRIQSEYDSGFEKEATDWINAVLVGSPLGDATGKDQIQEKLKDGVILCNLMNTLKPGSIPRIHPHDSNQFKHMENIANFLTAAEDYGCARGDLFQSRYLQDGENMVAVIGGSHALGRKAQLNGFSGPTLGPKESQANSREFTEEQLLHGRVHGI